jgi:thiamine biosynthesis lipoprotein
VRWLVGLTLVVILLASLPTSTLERFEAVEPHMGTLVRITLYAPDEDTARTAFRSAFDRIRALDRALSDYQPDSELNQLTRTAVGRPIAVSDDLFRVLSASQRLAEATNGAFDVTQGPVIRLWREARRTQRLPEPNALEDAATRGGYRKLHVDPVARTAMVDTADMALDLGAIGKGYAASEALDVLKRLGVRRALVAISGDLAFGDAPPGRRGWRIGIHSLDRAITEIPATLELTNGAVSTSGSSEQYVDIGGRRYSHVIDPDSKMGLTGDVTVTVVARRGIDADGLDTTISLIGPARGLALLDQFPDAAALIVRRTESGTTVVASDRFRALAARSRSSQEPSTMKD